MDSTNSGLSTYAIGLMALTLFCVVGDKQLTTTYQVFKKFLRTWGSFDWKNETVHLPTGNSKINDIVKRLSSSLASLLPDQLAGSSLSFSHRSCNIVDPLQPSNNLGFSVSMMTLSCIQHGLGEAYRHLCSVEDWERGDSHAVFTPSPRPSAGTDSGGGSSSSCSSSSTVKKLKGSKNSNPNSPARMTSGGGANSANSATG